MSINMIVFGSVLPWLIAGLFVGLGAWIGFQLIHQNGRLLARLEMLEQRLAELAARPPASAPVPTAAPSQPAPSMPQGLPLGSAGPAFELPDLNGRRTALADFRGRKLLLLFFNPRCGFCTRMGPDLAALPADGAEGRPVPLIVSTGDAEENRKLVEEHGIHCPVLLQQAMEVGSQYQCSGTPMGYLIDEQGHIASGLGIGAEALLALAAGDSRQAVDGSGAGHAAAGALGGKRGMEESKIERNGLPAGKPAPAFRLPLLYGGELSLEEYRGRPVLLVFSDPHCGPCDQLAPQLERQYRSSGEFQVLMVSRGEPEANRVKAAEHGLTFPIVLQRQWEISREYGMFATPIAYLIDAEGMIGREVAVGVEPILSLLAGPAFPTNGKAPAPRREKSGAGRRR